MKKTNRNGWFYVALGALIVSVLSLFTPIIVYTDGSAPRSLLQMFSGQTGAGSAGSFYGSYTILDLLAGDRFVKEVLVDYQGKVLWRIDTLDVIALALLAIAALSASLVGICTMRSQYHRKWQFIMTLAGLAGTAFPSLLIFYAAINRKEASAESSSAASPRSSCRSPH